MFFFPFRKFRDAVMSLKLVLIAPFLVCFESIIISQKGETFVNKSLALLRTLRQNFVILCCTLLVLVTA